MTTVATAEQAFERYQAFQQDGRLVQGSWHQERDGRQLACGLGVLGDDVTSARDCPAAVMPRWLARMVPWFFDRQNYDDAISWGFDFYAELKRLGGQVPFEVVYDWQANYVTTLAIEVSEKRGKPTDPHKEVQELHQRALNGDRAPVKHWRRALRAAYADAYAYAYAYADAYAYA